MTDDTRATGASHAPPPPLISVVIPVNNAESQLPALLEALGRQTLSDASVQVVVVDDASADATAAATRVGELAEVVRTPSRLGSYGARNLGISATRADVLAFTDGDCVPEPSWLENGLCTLSERHADLLAGHVEMPLGPRPSKAAVVDAALHMTQRAWVEAHGFGATANLFVRREVFDHVGAFDGALKRGGDTEFCHRAVAAGFRLEYAPDAVVVHEPRTARELAKKAYGIGAASAAHTRRPASDRPATTRAYWAQPRSWLPARRPFAEGRLAERNYHPKRGEMMALRFAHWLCYRLPRVAGSLVSSITARRGA